MKQARGGTLFLQGLESLGKTVQKELVSVLRNTAHGFRLIGTTNEDLEKLVDEGKFHDELFYRVASLPVHRAEFLEGLSASDAVEVHKTRDSAFVGTDLEGTLRSLGVDRLVLGGVSTEACVAMTAADAYARDFRVVIAGDVVASAQEEAHRAALDWLESQYRQPTCSNDQIEFTPSRVRG